MVFLVVDNPKWEVLVWRMNTVSWYDFKSPNVRANIKYTAINKTEAMQLQLNFIYGAA